MYPPGGDQISTAFLLTDRHGVSCKFSQNSQGGGYPQTADRWKAGSENAVFAMLFLDLFGEGSAKWFRNGIRKA